MAIYRHSRGNNIIFFGGDDCALMVENAPAVTGALPNCGPTGEALGLPQCVRKQVGVSAEATDAAVVYLPPWRRGIAGHVLAQGAEDELAVTAA